MFKTITLGFIDEIKQEKLLEQEWMGFPDAMEGWEEGEEVVGYLESEKRKRIQFISHYACSSHR